MILGWLPAFLSALLLFISTPASAQEEEQEQVDIEMRLAKETERIAADLAKKGELKLPPLPLELAEKQAPKVIRAAGEEYVKAWLTYRAITFWPPLQDKPALETKDTKQINAAEECEKFNDLLLRTIEANSSVEPSEYDRFTYSDSSWCADGVITFSSRLNAGIALASLRQGQHFRALQILSRRRFTPALAKLLQAHGVDSDEFIVGAWLNRQLSQHDFPPSSGNKVASMLLKWVELRWNLSGKDSATSCWKNDEEPYYPLEGFMAFLSQESPITDGIKAQIAHFLANQGCELHSQEYWLDRMSKGSGKWLVPLAQRALAAKTNRVRIRASKILTEAGIAHAEPELKKDPRFRFTVNGVPWPGALGNGNVRSEPGMSLDYGKDSGRAFSLSKAEDGTFSYEADSFLEGPEITKIEIYGFPGYTSSCSPASAWLRAVVPLPVRFGEITEIDVKLLGVSIKPKIPEERNTPARLIEIDFGRVDEGHSPSYTCYQLENAQQLTLPHVSPGDYWLRVRHPGTALMPWKKITISRDGEMIEPELTPGTTLVVPFDWPGGSAFREFPELRKDGKEFTDFGPASAALAQKFPKSVIFSNLVPGNYEVVTKEVRGRTIGTDSKFVIPSVSAKVTIREGDPVYLLSEPLVIRPQPAAD